ncbi:MAG: BlaI/MecI/CopY family transcriptional regulator [Planctomycetaceae bacterium]|nr:BlaI/MecI/CopY family transcriptional regulator [Planctomycetaceae bacterium]
MNNFTPGELEIMQILWQHDLLKPAEILERLGRPLTNPALRSALRVLMEKGHVTRQKQGKAYYYRARSAAPTAFRKMANRLADMFCGGSAFELIAQLIKIEKLSDDDIRQLQELAKNRAGATTATKPTKRKRS